MEDAGRPPRLVLLRHGESEWNNTIKNLFCGWVDVDLSEDGVKEAHEAAVALRDARNHFAFTAAFTSALHRAQRTLEIILNDLCLTLPTVASWRLNERHYGILTGLNKHEAVERFGMKQVEIWRRSYSIPPPPVPLDSPYHPTALLAQSHAPLDIDPSLLPATESLQDVLARFEPFWHSHLRPSLTPGHDVLLVAHGTTVRCIAKSLLKMSAEAVESFEVPTGLPFVLEFDETVKEVLRAFFIADDATVKAAQAKIRNQIRK